VKLKGFISGLSSWINEIASIVDDKEDSYFEVFKHILRGTQNCI
jgi:hypothetical protein